MTSSSLGSSPAVLLAVLVPCVTALVHGKEASVSFLSWQCPVYCQSNRMLLAFRRSSQHSKASCSLCCHKQFVQLVLLTVVYLTVAVTSLVDSGFLRAACMRQCPCLLDCLISRNLGGLPLERQCPLFFTSRELPEAELF